MPTTYARLPIAECPYCEHEFQWDDYYDVKAGEEHECPLCRHSIHVLSVDTVIEARLGVVPEA